MSKKKAVTKVGRPIKQLDPVKVRELAATGLTDQQLASSLGVCRETLRTRISEDKAVREAYQMGEAEALAMVEKTMFNLAKEGDSAACRFILSTRRRDTYTTRQEVANPDGAEFRIAARPYSDEERKEAIKDIAQVLENEI